jgi:hypothetical protein
LQKRFCVKRWGHCNPWRAILDYVESLRLGDYGVTGGHGAMSERHMTRAVRRLPACRKELSEHDSELR